jgi:hypothetical protein
MAGNGDIGGGSCKFRFTAHPPGKATAPVSKWEYEDTSTPTGQGTTVTFKFPGGSSKEVRLQRGQRVKISWT